MFFLSSLTANHRQPTPTNIFSNLPLIFISLSVHTTNFWPTNNIQICHIYLSFILNLAENLANFKQLIVNHVSSSVFLVPLFLSLSFSFFFLNMIFTIILSLQNVITQGFFISTEDCRQRSRWRIPALLHWIKQPRVQDWRLLISCLASARS